MLAGYGMPQHEIAKLLRIAPKTLRAHYREQLDRGGAIATTRVAAALYKVASAGTGREAVTACIFWLRARAGWSEYTPWAPSA